MKVLTDRIGWNNVRNSKIELFRILAAFFVVFEHLNGYFVGLDPIELNFHSSFQTIILSFCVPAVNCFIVISGFFGLKLKWKSLWNLYVTLFCIYFPLACIRVILGNSSINLVFQSVLALSYENYFINGYVLLLFFSPVLNAFIEKVGRKSLWFVILLIIIEFYTDCLRDNPQFGFNHGYSALHFIVLYLAARCFSLFIEDVKRIKMIIKIALYFVSSLMIFLLCKNRVPWALNYTNPFVILACFSLFSFFLHGEFHSRMVNFVASSTLCVYILHITGPLETILIKYDNAFLNSYSYPVYVLITIVMTVLVFIISVLYDKIRLLLLSGLFEKIGNGISSGYARIQTALLGKINNNGE